MVYSLQKESAANFQLELVEAARAHLGQPAIHHQRLAGNCLEGVTPKCLEVGLGPPEGHDCSGLQIAAISQVRGTDPADWPLELRHVRDLWQAAENQQFGLSLGGVSIGNFIVTPRKWRVGDTQQEMPGHIGIISRIDEEGVWMIHASPEAGLVEESLLRHPSPLGTIALTD